MIGPVRGSVGLLGRVLAILLLTTTLEFATSTWLYERAGRFSVRDDEARRLAEHLVIARKLLVERPPAARPAIAEELSTDRYEVDWSRTRPLAATGAPELDGMRRQILAWEPGLARSGLVLRLPSPARPSAIRGELGLPDGSWIAFAMHDSPGGLSLARDRILLALLPALLVIGLGALLVRQTLKPLRRLEDATERVGIDSPEQLPEEGSEDVRRLIRAFNAMHRRIAGLIEERTEALAAVGHDLRTPIARLRLRLEDHGEPAVRRAATRDLAEMEGMLASLLAYLAGDDDPETPVPVDLAVLAATLADERADHGKDVAYRGPDHAEAEVRPIALRRALSNLIENAVRYGGGAAVTVSVLDEPDALVLRVDDGGPGIPPDQLDAVLRPFTRLDPARERNTGGLGLGLAIVQRVVTREGGTLLLANRAEGGLRAEIRLPRGTPDKPGNDSLHSGRSPAKLTP